MRRSVPVPTLKVSSTSCVIVLIASFTSASKCTPVVPVSTSPKVKFSGTVNSAATPPSATKMLPDKFSVGPQPMLKIAGSPTAKQR